MHLHRTSLYVMPTCTVNGYEEQRACDVNWLGFCRRGFPLESFDAVLLDGPCSGLGLRPRLVHRLPLQELAQAKRSTFVR